jgi:hypothetical protein
MRRSTTFTLVLLTALLVSSASLGFASAVDYTKVGVKNGDTAHYSGIGGTAGNITTGTMDLLFWNITGTIVSANATLRWPNGTLILATTAKGNLTDGVQYGVFPIFVFLVVPNLSVNDSMVIDSPGQYWKINETITMTAGGASRSVNHLIAPGAPNGLWDLYWDKETGITVKASIQTDPGNWMNWTMTSTSLWSGGLPVTTLILIAAGVGVVVIVVAVYFIKVRHK